MINPSKPPENRISHCSDRCPCQDLEKDGVYVALRGKLVEEPRIDVVEGWIPGEPDCDPLNPLVTYDAKLKVDAAETIFDVSRLSTDLHGLQRECRAIMDVGQVRLQGSMHNLGDCEKPSLLVQVDEWIQDGEASKRTVTLEMPWSDELEGIAPEDLAAVTVAIAKLVREPRRQVVDGVGDEPEHASRPSEGLIVAEELAEVFRVGVLAFWEYVPEGRRDVVLDACRKIIEQEIDVGAAAGKVVPPLQVP